MESENNIITGFELSQNYPNPFNPSTTIEYSILRSSSQSNGLLERYAISLKVYDALGQEVSTLVNKKQSSGKYQVLFDAKNMATGIYIYELKAGQFTQSKKMLLLR